MKIKWLLLFAALLLLGAAMWVAICGQRLDCGERDGTAVSTVGEAAASGPVERTRQPDSLSTNPVPLLAPDGAAAGSDGFAGDALAGWPGATLVGAWQGVRGMDGSRRRVAILQPADLPYRVRVEEVRLPDGRTQLVETVADHVLVQLAEGMDVADWPAELSALGIEPGRAINTRGLWRVRIDGGDPEALPRALEAIAAIPGLTRYAEPDHIVRAFREPDDPRYLDGSLWGLRNTGQNNGVAGADISAPQGWEVRTDASTVIVGIIDSGIRLTHEDLAANLWVNPNEAVDGTDTDGNGFIDDLHGINAIRLDGNPLDDNGHGSHVAGTAGAVGDNGIGVTGVAWNVQLMGLKFLSATGGGATSDAIICIDYGVAHGAHILNNSWGGSFYSAALHDAVAAARDAGVIFVVAAGNSATDNDAYLVFPASLPVDNLVTVASTTRRDALADSSCYGQGSVDLAAPGAEIFSVGIDSDSHYRTLSGTSMAAPHVSGALALLRAEFPDDSPGQLINRLYRGTDTIPALAGGVVATGGRLNLHGALTTTDNRPFNDDFADARLLYGDIVLLRASNRGATTEPGEPAIGDEAQPNTVWFTFIPGATGLTTVRAAPTQTLFNPMRAEYITISQDNIPTVIAAYRGPELDTLEAVATGADQITFASTGGEPYHIAVAGSNGAEGLIMLEVVGPPRNSAIANAIQLTRGRAVSGININAQAEPGEPDHAGQPPAASVWYKWNAAFPGRVAFSTNGSNINTVAAVYTGPADEVTMADLTPVASNINAPGATFSRVDFQATAGTTYYFAVDGFNGAQGTINAVLAIPPDNDDFANSTVLSGASVERRISTVFASREQGEPRHLPGRGNGETIWYTWTAPENGRITLSLSGSFMPAIVAAYTGDRVDQLTLVVRDGAGNRPVRATFDAVQGVTYRIAIEAWDWSLYNTPFHLESTPVPPNEKFADAIVLEGRRATVTGTNAGAGSEPGEPAAGRSGSVWYRWTAPVSGEVGIYGERLDKPRLWNVVLNVFTGDAVNALTHVKEDYGNGIGRDAFLRWHAVAGRTYHIQVTSLGRDQLIGGNGPFTLDLRPRAEHAPPNDHFADAIELDGPLVYNLRTHNYATSAEPGEPSHAGMQAGETIWWKFTPGPGQGGRYAIGTGFSESALVTTVYRCTNPASPSFASLVEVANNHLVASLTFPDVAWEAVAGETYYMVLDRGAGTRGRVIFHLHKVPDNIRFAGAQVIEGDSARIITHNWGSVREPGEPSLGAKATQLGARSLWWKWTAPRSGRYQLDTIGSETPVSEDGIVYPERTMLGFDTRLGVFTGSAIGSLSQVAVNDSRAPETYSNTWISEQRNSRLEFNAVAGVTYTFLVNGENIAYNGTDFPNATSMGRIRLNLTRLLPPANDRFADATVITGTHYRTIQPTFGATKEPGEPNHGGINGGRSLWWKWTAPRTGKIVVSTAGNIYDDYHARRTGLGVYYGSSVDALITVASNQNGAGMNTGDSTWSSIAFTAGAGVTYHFGVDAAIAGNLSFILTEPAPNDHFADATEMRGSRWVATGHHLETTIEPGEPRVDGGYISEPDNNFRSVWWKWTAPVSGEVTVDTLGSQSCNVIGVFTGDRVDALTPVTDVPKSGGNPHNGDAERRARDGNNRGPAVFMAVAGTTYRIKVEGSGYIVTSSGPIVLTLVGPPAIPFAPDEFSAARAGPARIDLQWSDTAVDEEAYVIERSLDGVDWELLHEAPPDSTRHTDFDAPAGQTVHYRIQARNSVGASPFTHATWRSVLEQWRFRHFATHENAGAAADTAAPHGDGVANLLKYAFNMDPSGYDDRVLDPRAGAAGLPCLVPGGLEDGRLTLVYLRRKAATFPGITYVAEFAGELGFGAPVVGETVGVASVDEAWERVTVRDPDDSAAAPSRFGRVRVGH